MTCNTSSPIQLTVGSDAEHSFQLSDDNGPINITNDIIRLYVAVSEDKPNLLIKSTEDIDQAVKIDPVMGKVKFIFVPADTDAGNGGLKARTYVYDIWRETASGKHKQHCTPTPFIVSEGVGR